MTGVERGRARKRRRETELTPIRGRTPALLLAEAIEQHRGGHEGREEENAHPEAHFFPPFNLQIA